MFQRNKVDFLYRMLCLLAFLIVIIFINSDTTVLIITFAFFVLTIFEKRFENMFLYVITAIIFIICLVMKNYLLIRIITCVDYIHYFLNVETLGIYDEDDEIIVSKNDRYFKYKKIERKANNNGLCTTFVVLHLVLLLLAIVVG